MSKEYGYFEAMEEIIKDENKVFIGGSEHNKKLFYNRTFEKIRIADKSDNFEYSYPPTINYFWKNTKWTLAEEKKKYNVRVYSVTSNKLISSEIVVMTKEEIENYRKELFNKGKVEEDIKSGIGEGIVLFKINKYEHEIVSEEIITN